MIPESRDHAQAPADILAAGGIDFTQSGRSLRLRATWRGGDGRSVSVHAETGQWYDHVEHVGGGFRRLLALLGIEGAGEIAAPTAEQIEAAAQRRDDGDREAVATAEKIYRSGKFVSGGIAAHRAIIERYLSSRGLDIDRLPSAAKMRPTVEGIDLIMPIRTLAREITAVSVLSLTTDGRKVDHHYAAARKTHGRKPAGAHVRLPARYRDRAIAGYERAVLVAEGVETALAAQDIVGANAVACVDARGVEKMLDDPAMAMAMAGYTIIACADRDLSGTGQRAAAALVRRARSLGIEARYAEPPAFIVGGPKGADWNDVLTQIGDDDGRRAAFASAIALGEDILAKIDDPNAEKIAEYVAPEGAVDVGEAHARVRESAREYLRGQIDMVLASPPTGSGKSHAIAREIEQSEIDGGGGIALLVPTTALAEAAGRSNAIEQRHGRSGDIDLIGYCAVFPEIQPLGERWRSIVAQKCGSCAHGLAASEQIRGEAPSDPSVMPCSYLLHHNQIKQTTAVVAPSAAYDHDPSLARVRVGDGSLPRAVIADDCLSMTIEATIAVDEIAQWAQTASISIRIDDVRAAKEIDTDEREKIEARIEATRRLAPHIDRLATAVAACTAAENHRLAPAEWADFVDAAGDSALDVIDGTAAERIYSDEGRTIIPLRALRATARAIASGTAWARSSTLHITTPTKIAESMLVGKGYFADATPSMLVRAIAEARGARVVVAPIATPNLRIEQIISAAGKTACQPDSPSGQRHLARACDMLRASVRAEGRRDAVAIITHLALAERLREIAEHDPTLPPPENIGHYGRHDRGHNDWRSVRSLVAYGAPALSPSAAERCYEAERALARAAGIEWPEWDGSRAVIEADFGPVVAKATANADDHIRAWAADWQAARIAQAVGRLRATRRADDPLRVTIVHALPVHGQHGIQVRAIRRAPWRDHAARRAAEQASQIARACFARALGAESVRAARAGLHRYGLDGIRNADFARLLASVPAREMALFASGNRSTGIAARIDALLDAIALPAGPALTRESAIAALDSAQPPADVALAREIIGLLRASPPPPSE